MLLSLGSSCWVVCGLVCLQGQIPKRHQFRRDWTPCSKYVDHSRLNIQHNYGHLHDHLMSMKIFSLILNKMFIWAPKIMVKWLRPLCRFAKHLKHPTVGANGTPTALPVEFGRQGPAPATRQRSNPCRSRQTDLLGREDAMMISSLQTPECSADRQLP